MERVERNEAAQVGGVLEGNVLKEINDVDISAISVRYATSLMPGPEGAPLLLCCGVLCANRLIWS